MAERASRAVNEAGSEGDSRATSLVYLLGVSLATVVLAEAVVMLVLPLLPPLSVGVTALLDAALLGLVVYPLLYLLVFRPLRRQLRRAREAEDRHRRLVRELGEALAEVKRLSGLLPICASCKKIRDDKGYWSHVESYIAAHSEAMFSHSLCPACARTLFADLDVDMDLEDPPGGQEA
jgi:hypothetical protein